ncbi:hypothetical protein [Tepidiforma thermophila]|uniref:STAS/SEC14 domain-containing protein n=1 Tax=Tepidiforma thermophila (strain KCTC 52669 / CGMCC 1.13589 / G233) TaxID=2761530 RepID=A0A2A9HC65_TEPT2|nr:hypothetical protein [Tepidiforma thermophila]PFG73328.1 hypothetical protein A9A59_0523 [Tepidiforma thermophila]
MAGEHACYTVVEVPARLTGAWLAAGEWLKVPAGGRVLVDAAALETAEMEAGALAAAAEQLAARAGRIAVYAPGDLAFGLARQALQLAGVAEGVTMAVFREREAALRWLLGGEGAAK